MNTTLRSNVLMSRPASKGPRFVSTCQTNQQLTVVMRWQNTKRLHWRTSSKQRHCCVRSRLILWSYFTRWWVNSTFVVFLVKKLACPDVRHSYSSTEYSASGELLVFNSIITNISTNMNVIGESTLLVIQRVDSSHEKRRTSRAAFLITI